MADNQSPELFGQTPEQTIGPYFHFAMPAHGGADLVGRSDMGSRPELFPANHNSLGRSLLKGAFAGETIEVFGHVLDGEGKPVGDALIETWQANTAGRYANADDFRTELPLDASFAGFGRAATREDGVFRLRTIRPGTVPGPRNMLQAPHIAVGILGRGILKRLVTRIYFADAPENRDDPILALVPEARRGTLFARPTAEGWQFDIILCGTDETVFFQC